MFVTRTKWDSPDGAREKAKGGWQDGIRKSKEFVKGIKQKLMELSISIRISTNIYARVQLSL